MFDNVEVGDTIVVKHTGYMPTWYSKAVVEKVTPKFIIARGVKYYKNGGGAVKQDRYTTDIIDRVEKKEK